MLDDKQPQLTPLDKIGSFGLINHLTQSLKRVNKSTKKAVGDDAAVLNFEGEERLVSTEMMVEGVHFNLAYVPIKHLGYKSVIVNLSDLCVMNANPTRILVSFAVSNRFPLEVLEELYAGIDLACKQYKVYLIGVDTTSSTSGFIIIVTAIGKAKSEDIFYSDGAHENDLLVVT